MRTRLGPTERELTLSNGVNIRSILDAPRSFTHPEARAVSPTLLRVVSRRAPPKYEAKPTRECIIGLMQREMVKTVAPNHYQPKHSFAQKGSGSYSHGILFSSTSRGLESIPNNLPTIHTPRGAAEVREQTMSIKRSPPTSRSGSASKRRHQQQDPQITTSSGELMITEDGLVLQHGGDGESFVSPIAAARENLQQQLPSSPASSRPGTAASVTGISVTNLVPMSSPRGAAAAATTTMMSSRQSQLKNAATTYLFKPQQTSLPPTTFGAAPRIMDMDVGTGNPYLRRKERAPPPGAYSYDGSARGGARKMRASKFYGNDRVIDLARKTAAPGPAVYDTSSYKDIGGPSLALLI